MTALDAKSDPNALLAALSPQDKICLTAGADLWRTFGAAGLPYAKLSDGPNGARGGGPFNHPTPAALFPSPICLGATWDMQLAQEMGRGIATDARTKQVHCLLAPTINIVRDPRNGRSFETYSEDALLCGTLGGAFARGVQSTGVAATLKHFVANEAETSRRFSSSNVPEAALRHVYLRSFQLALREVARAHAAGEDSPAAQAFHGTVGAIMTAYNRLNRISCSEHEELYNGILRREWGFDGLVMSDWFALHAHGLRTTDLEMPGPSLYRRLPDVQRLMAPRGSADGVTEADVDARALSVLRFLTRVAPLGFTKLEEEREDDLESDEINLAIRRIAAEGAVLLKNDNGLLPLDAKCPPERIALVGWPCVEPLQSGGGSANLAAQHTSSLRDAVRDALGADDHVDCVFEPGCAVWKFPPAIPRDELVGGVRYEWFNGQSAEQRALIAITESDDEPGWDTLAKGPPKPACEGKLRAGDWSLRVTFRLRVREGGNPQVLAFNCLGRLIARFEGQDDALEIKGETDFFEYGLNPRKIVCEAALSSHPGPARNIVVDYYPQQGVDTFCDENFFGAFELGLYERIDPEIGISMAARQAANAGVAIVLVGTGPQWESEGFDRPDLRLPRHQDRLVEAVLKGQPNTVVINVSGAAVEMPWVDQAATLVQAWFGGQESGRALGDVLFGRGFAPASGRMPATWPRRLIDLPTAAAGKRCFPGDDEQDDPVGPNVYYEEGLDLGHRHYEKRAIEPLFWFGQGIGGYTAFDAQLKGISGDLTAESNALAQVHVENRGMRSGRYVVQLYVLDFPTSGARSLAAFQSVRLQAGEGRDVVLVLGADIISTWAQGTWTAHAGAYPIVLADSAAPAAELARAELHVPATFSWNGLGPRATLGA